MNQKHPLEILKDNLRKLDKEELIDMLADIMQVSLAAVMANSIANVQKLNNAIAEQNCSLQTVRVQEIRQDLYQNCAQIEQSLNEFIQNYKDEKAKRFKGN